MSNSGNNSFLNDNSAEFNENHHEKIMREYHKYNQDKMTADEIWKLKSKTFPYLSNDEVRLNMSDRNIIRKEFDLDTDSVLSDTDKQSVRDFFTLFENVCPPITTLVSIINCMYRSIQST